MIKKILCPAHEEKTPSLVLYPNGNAHCFGCGYHTSAESLGVKLEDIPEPYVEDLEKAVTYIRGLPKQNIRGLQLPADPSSYYVLWPDASYYKRRFFDVKEGAPKYVGASGHVKAPFDLTEGKSTKSLIIVEGEINALSLVEAMPDQAVISPGGSGDFYSKVNEKYLPTYLKYENILLVVDHDAAGAIAGIKLKSKLAQYTTRVKISLWKDDSNSLLEKHGKEALKEEIIKSWEVGM